MAVEQLEHFVVRQRLHHPALAALDVSAFQSALSTASSVASTAALKNGSRSRSGTPGGPGAPPAARGETRTRGRSRRSRGGPPSRCGASPRPARRADAGELGRAQRRVGRDDDDAAPAGRAGPGRARPSSRPTGTPSTRRSARAPKLASTSTPTVAPPRRSRLRRADAALPVEAHHAGARTHRSLATTLAAAASATRPAGVGRLHLDHARVVQPAVVALADHRDHHVLDADRGSAATAAATAPSYTRPTDIVAVR